MNIILKFDPRFVHDSLVLCYLWLIIFLKKYEVTDFPKHSGGTFLMTYLVVCKFISLYSLLVKCLTFFAK